jgi:hypothetical protein
VVDYSSAFLKYAEAKHHEEVDYASQGRDRYEDPTRANEDHGIVTRFWREVEAREMREGVMALVEAWPGHVRVVRVKSDASPYFSRLRALQLGYQSLKDYGGSTAVLCFAEADFYYSNA